MANISTAQGQMVLKGPWTKDLVEKANIVFFYLSDLEYGIIKLNNFEFSEDSEPEANFTGYGRWDFHNTLNAIGRWIRDYYEYTLNVLESKNIEEARIVAEAKDAYRSLMSTMEKEDLTIELGFLDVEEGLQVFYSGTGILYVEDGMFEYNQCEWDDLPWTWDALSETGCYGETFEEISGILCRMLGVSDFCKDQVALVDSWIDKTVYPTEWNPDFEEGLDDGRYNIESLKRDLRELRIKKSY